MAITIAEETPLQDDVRRLVADLNAHLIPLSPPEFQFQLTVEQMANPETHLFVARDEDRAVGMGALKVHGDELGELKRMFTLPEVRGQRIGSLLLTALTDHARTLGITRLKLETGVEATMPEAHRLYQRGGFTPCAAFADYPASPHNAFYERAL